MSTASEAKMLADRILGIILDRFERKYDNSNRSLFESIQSEIESELELMYSDPGDIFTEDSLIEWAENNGFKKEAP